MDRYVLSLDILNDDGDSLIKIIRTCLSVMQQRAWDDFKDDNPRGWGNSRLRPTG